MNIVKPVCKFVKNNGPLLLTISACGGVVVSNFLTGKAVLKADKILKDIPDSELKTLETKKKLAAVYAAPVAVCLGTISFIAGAYILDKHIQAGLAAAVGTISSVFNAYRMKTDPEIDRQALTEIAVERIRQNDIPAMIEEGSKLWTDPYIYELSKGQVSCYAAKESDILRAAMYTKDIFYNRSDVSIRTFYNVLRNYGVDIPIMEGEDDIFWEIDNEWFDFYGEQYFEFDWTEARNEYGAIVNTIIFSLTNKEMKEEEEKMKWFVEKLANQKSQEQLAKNDASIMKSE